MTDTTNIERDKKSGRFVTGSNGGPGRKIGSRNKLSADFLADLHSTWRELGLDALRRCAAEEPGRYCQIYASLLPRDIRIDQHVTIDPGEFIDRFRAARAMLGNGKVIEHGD